MWSDNKLTRILGIEYPIILAPMGGGAGTPQLAAAVSNSGGLGSLGAGYLSADQIRTAIRQTRELTASWTYVRFHGSRGPGGDYTDAELGTWRRRIAAWRRSVSVYAYFNNDWALSLDRGNLERYVRFANELQSA